MGITALLQTGPRPRGGGTGRAGLSKSDARRRAFIATDGRGHWVLGATLSTLTLAELAQSLAAPGVLTSWRVDQAINLEAGSSTGFFFDRKAGEAPVALHPWKRVRSLLGIRPR